MLIHHLTPVFDESNDDVTYFRNRLRHELLPILENYNPAIRGVFLRMGQVFRDDYSVLEKIIDSAWESTLIQMDKGFLIFRTQEFNRLPTSIQRYVLRRAISHLIPGLRDVDFKSIERGRMLVVGEKRNSQSDLIAGLRLIKEGEQFVVASEQVEFLGEDSPAILSDDKWILTNQAVLILNQDWQLEIDEVLNAKVSNILEIRRHGSIPGIPGYGCVGIAFICSETPPRGPDQTAWLERSFDKNLRPDD